MKKIFLIATLFVAAYSATAQNAVPTPGTHVNGDNLTFTILEPVTGHPKGGARVEGVITGLGAATKGSYSYLVDGEIGFDRDCENPAGVFPPGQQGFSGAALSIGSSIVRNGRMPFSATAWFTGNTLCPNPFNASYGNWGFVGTISIGVTGANTNTYIEIPIK